MTWTCPACGHENPDAGAHEKWCGACDHAERMCPECGSPLDRADYPPGGTICPECDWRSVTPEGD